MKFILVLIMSMSSAFAVENDIAAWLGTFIKKPLNQKYSIWMDAQVRYSLDEGETAQTLYRTGLLYQYDENIEYGLLYANFQTSGISEHRPTLELRQNFGVYRDLKLSSRARAELRVFEDESNDHLRGRYLLRLDTENDYIVWDEVFLNVTNNKKRDGDFFDQNWLFIGKKIEFKEFNIEAGYLNQYIPFEDQSVMEHVAVLYMFL